MKNIKTIESHTSGEPTRIVIDGFPTPIGNTMMDKKIWLENNCNDLKNAIIREPRGHKDMVGALITKPCNPKADVGVVFMDAFRWINMCGHASMGVAYSVINDNIVPNKDKVVLDTPAGLVTVKVNANTNECALENVPSFLALKNCNVKLNDLNIPFNVSFGGTFFAIVNLNDINMSIDNLDIPYLINFSKQFLKEANKNYSIKHPFENIDRIVNVEYYEKQNNIFRNIVLSEQGEIDRSPCGTGTSAELANLIGEGLLNADDVLINTNFLNVTFTAKVKQNIELDKYKAIIPEVTGKAYITGHSEYNLEVNDPLKYGFVLD